LKSKFLSLLVALVMLLQISIVAPVFSSGSTSAKFAVDFSDSAAQYNVSNTIAGTFDYSIVKGQYGKAADDASIRLYSVGGSADGMNAKKTLKIETYDVPVASDGQYSHLSYQFLNEDGYSILGVNIGYYLPDNVTKKFDKQIMTQPRTATIWKQNRILPNAGTNKKNIDSTTGTWSQVDIYFSPTSTADTVLFVNGTKYSVDATNWNADSGKPEHGLVGRIFRVEFITTPKSASPYMPSAIQIDNVIIERVDSVPDSQNYRYPGESFNFDDNMTIGDNGSYTTSYYHSAKENKPRFDIIKGTDKLGVQFKSTTANTIQSGVYGRRLWDNSLHTMISDSAAAGESALYYTPGVQTLKSGDSVHLTFAIANAKSDTAAGISTKEAKIGSDTIAFIDLFEMSSDGNFRFFGENIGEEWQRDRWYKVDMIFNISSDTKADCYIDGVACLDDYVVNSAAMSLIGTLGFADTEGADYYVDDVAFGLAQVDPADGWELDTDDADLSDAIDNNARVITIAGNYKAEDFMKKIKNPECVTLFNSNGTSVYSGLLANCAVKVSNNFGSGIWYGIVTTGVITEADLFDIADGASVNVSAINKLNVSASGEDTPVIKTAVYMDGKLFKTANTDEMSIDLSALMLGTHKVEAFAYVNGKDCYTDSIEFTLVEEVEKSILKTYDFEDYAAGSSSITGGRIVQEGARTLAETVTDKNGKNYGTSVVLEGTKALYTSAGKHNLYMDINTPDSDMITKAVLEFDICLLSDNAAASTRYRGKTDLASTDTKASTVSTGKIGVESSLGEHTMALESNKWYHIKSMMDVKNGVASLWIDDAPLYEDTAVSTDVVQLASEMRIQFALPAGTYDSVDSIRFAAMDNISLTEYDELAYVKSVKDAQGGSPVDYTADVLTVNMSNPVDEIDVDAITLYSSNGERDIESVVIDSDDASILYVTPKYKLSSADTYSLVIDKGLKSSGAFSSKENCGIFETTSKTIDVLSGSFVLVDEKMIFTAKLTNKDYFDKELTIIAYVYEGGEFKGIAPKTVVVKAGKNLTESVELPYYSASAKVYALVVEDWSTMKPVSNKLYSLSY